MKKILSILVVFAMVATALPAVAGTSNIISGLARDGDQFCGTFPVSVNYESSSGGNNDGGNNAPPVIKCKFEVAEEDCGTMYSPMPGGHSLGYSGVDADLTEEGTQVDPPLIYGEYNWVGYYVVVYDADNNEEINQVAVNVYHPTGQITKPYKSNEPHLGIADLKYDVVLQKVDKFAYIDFLEYVHSLEADGNYIIKYNEDDHEWDTEGYSSYFDEVIAELLNCEADLYYGHSKIHYCQPAGYYRVDAKASDTHGGMGYLSNCFEYTLGVGIETDFDSIDFGDARFNQLKWLHGDWIWDNDKPTIRNIGNWDTRITAEFTDLGLGKSDLDGDGDVDDWNVVYDARIGDAYGAPRGNKSYAEKNSKFIEPFTEVTIPVDQWCRVDKYDVLRKCNTTKISFAIKILKILPYDEYEDGAGLTLCVNVPPYVYKHYNGLPTCPTNPWVAWPWT